MSKQPYQAIVEYPNELEIVISRSFDAPIELVFDAFTKPEHVSKTFATYGEDFTVCDIDLRVGGDYHFVMVTKDGVECSFRGTYLEVDSPTKTVETWRFEGWPGVEAIESIELRFIEGVTNLTWRMKFEDKAGRDRMSTTEGVEGNLENVHHYLNSLLER